MLGIQTYTGNNGEGDYNLRVPFAQCGSSLFSELLMVYIMPILSLYYLLFYCVECTIDTLKIEMV